jgi:hypothetical protein
LEAVEKYQNVIHLPITLAIKNISEIHKNIHLHFAENSDIVLDIPAEAEADLSFVQLVESARMDARAAGKTLRLNAPVTGSVLKVLQRGGFIDALSADDAQFWLHQEVRV